MPENVAEAKAAVPVSVGDAENTVEPHVPVDRRTLLPISPVQRPAASADVAVPGHAWIPRARLTDGPVANLKLASGCDRRCTFCAIPSFRGSFVSRPPDDVVAEAAWLGMEGVRELYLVSENSTSYGKDLPGGTRALFFCRTGRYSPRRRADVR